MSFADASPSAIKSRVKTLDVALVFFAMLALLLGLTVATPWRMLGDPDSQWHVAIGRWIWAHRALPHVDEFSHTFAGRPWLAKEWLSQLAYYGVFVLAGWRGVVLLACTAIAGAMAFLYAFLAARVRAIIALAIVLAACSLVFPHMVARPHVLTYPVILAWMALLVQAREAERAPPVWQAALMVLWVNMHGSFPLGVVMAGILCAEGVLLGAQGTFWSRARAWAPFMVATAVAIVMTPYGLEALLIAAKLEGNPQVLRYVLEWNPLSLDGYGIAAVAAMLAAFAALAAEPRRNAFRILAVGLLSYMAFDHVRFVSTFALVAPMLVASALARRPAFSAAGEAGDAPPPEAAMRAVCVALAAAAVGLAIWMKPMPAPEITPDAALRAAQAAGLTGRLYNHYDFGGYLIDSEVKTFFDGRTDQLFMGDFIPTLVAALEKKDTGDFSALLARYQVSWALVPTDSVEAKRFRAMPDWRLVHDDAIAAVFARR